MRLSIPQPAPLLRLQDIHGQPMNIGSRGTPTLLSFFREADCPFCNFRVYELTHNFPMLAALEVEIIVVFSSDEARVRRFIAKQPRPFRMVADPADSGHRAYGIERSWLGKLRASILRFPSMVRGQTLVGPGGRPTGTQMPADFLIDAKGQVVDAYYGKDAGDHIPLDRLPAFAAKALGRPLAA